MRPPRQGPSVIDSKDGLSIHIASQRYRGYRIYRQFRFRKADRRADRCRWQERDLKWDENLSGITTVSQESEARNSRLRDSIFLNLRTLSSHREERCFQRAGAIRGGSDPAKHAPAPEQRGHRAEIGTELAGPRTERSARRDADRGRGTGSNARRPAPWSIAWPATLRRGQNSTGGPTDEGVTVRNGPLTFARSGRSTGRAICCQPASTVIAFVCPDTTGSPRQKPGSGDPSCPDSRGSRRPTSAFATAARTDNRARPATTSGERGREAGEFGTTRNPGDGSFVRHEHPRRPGGLRSSRDKRGYFSTTNCAALQTPFWNRGTIVVPPPSRSSGASDNPCCAPAPSRLAHVRGARDRRRRGKGRRPSLLVLHHRRCHPPRGLPPR